MAGAFFVPVETPRCRRCHTSARPWLLGHRRPEIACNCAGQVTHDVATMDLAPLSTVPSEADRTTAMRVAELVSKSPPSRPAALQWLQTWLSGQFALASMAVPPQRLPFKRRKLLEEQNTSSAGSADTAGPGCAWLATDTGEVLHAVVATGLAVNARASEEFASWAVQVLQSVTIATVTQGSLGGAQGIPMPPVEQAVTALEDCAEAAVVIHLLTASLRRCEKQTTTIGKLATQLVSSGSPAALGVLGILCTQKPEATMMALFTTLQTAEDPAAADEYLSLVGQFVARRFPDAFENCLHSLLGGWDGGTSSQSSDCGPEATTPTTAHLAGLLRHLLGCYKDPQILVSIVRVLLTDAQSIRMSKLPGLLVGGLVSSPVDSSLPACWPAWLSIIVNSTATDPPVFLHFLTILTAMASGHANPDGTLSTLPSGQEAAETEHEQAALRILRFLLWLAQEEISRSMHPFLEERASLPDCSLLLSLSGQHAAILELSNSAAANHRPLVSSQLALLSTIAAVAGASDGPLQVLCACFDSESSNSSTPKKPQFFDFALTFLACGCNLLPDLVLEVITKDGRNSDRVQQLFQYSEEFTT